MRVRRPTVRASGAENRVERARPGQIARSGCKPDHIGTAIGSEQIEIIGHNGGNSTSRIIIGHFRSNRCRVA